MPQFWRSYHSNTVFLHLTENRHCRFVWACFCGFHSCSELLRRRVWSVPVSHYSLLQDENARLMWFFPPNSFCGLFTRRIRHKSQIRLRRSVHHNTLTNMLNQREKNNNCTNLLLFTDPLQQQLRAPQCNTSESSSRVYGLFLLLFFLVDANVDSNRQPWSKHTQ